MKMLYRELMKDNATFVERFQRLEFFWIGRLAVHCPRNAAVVFGSYVRRASVKGMFGMKMIITGEVSEAEPLSVSMHH